MAVRPQIARPADVTRGCDFSGQPAVREFLLLYRGSFTRASLIACWGLVSKCCGVFTRIIRSVIGSVCPGSSDSEWNTWTETLLRWATVQCFCQPLWVIGDTMNSAAHQHHSRWLPQASVTAKSAWMQMFALSVTNFLLLQLTFAQAASLHSNHGLQCNHVHPKPNDVSKLSLLTPALNKILKPNPMVWLTNCCNSLNFATHKALCLYDCVLIFNQCCYQCCYQWCYHSC